MDSSTPKAALIETALAATRRGRLSNTLVVHAIPGRIRLRVRALKSAPDLAGALEAFLKVQPGMTEARVNRWCHSVTVTCDPLHWTADRLCALLQSLRHEDIMRYEFLVLSANGARDFVRAPWIQPSKCWTIVGYVTLMLGIVLFVLPMVPGGVPFLVLSSLCFSKATTLLSLEAPAIS